MLRYPRWSLNIEYQVEPFKVIQDMISAEQVDLGQGLLVKVFGRDGHEWHPSFPPKYLLMFPYCVQRLVTTWTYCSPSRCWYNILLLGIYQVWRQCLAHSSSENMTSIGLGWSSGYIPPIFPHILKSPSLGVLHRVICSIPQLLIHSCPFRWHKSSADFTCTFFLLYITPSYLLLSSKNICRTVFPNSDRSGPNARRFH